MIRAFKFNCHRNDAWYIRVIGAIPYHLRPVYIESVRVEYDTTSFCRVGVKYSVRRALSFKRHA